MENEYGNYKAFISTSNKSFSNYFSFSRKHLLFSHLLPQPPTPTFAMSDPAFAFISSYLANHAVTVMSTTAPATFKPAQLASDEALLEAATRRGRYTFRFLCSNKTWNYILSRAAAIEAVHGPSLSFSDGSPHNDERLFVPSAAAVAAIFEAAPTVFDGIRIHSVEHSTHPYKHIIVPGAFAVASNASLRGPGLLLGRSWNGYIKAGAPAPVAAYAATTTAAATPTATINPAAQHVAPAIINPAEGVYALHFAPVGGGTNYAFPHHRVPREPPQRSRHQSRCEAC